MSTHSTCELPGQAVNIVRHALEKDLNGRGWLQPGYVFFVQEIEEPGVVLLIENCNSPAVSSHDAFPMRLEVEWEDINPHAIKNKLALAVGAEKACQALSDVVRTRFAEKAEAPRRGLRLHERLGSKL